MTAWLSSYILDSFITPSSMVSSDWIYSDMLLRWLTFWVLEIYYSSLLLVSVGRHAKSRSRIMKNTFIFTCLLHFQFSDIKPIFSDKRLRLFLYDIATERKESLISYCSYVQWVPGSDVIVAQGRAQQLSVWWESFNWEYNFWEFVQFGRFSLSTVIKAHFKQLCLTGLIPDKHCCCVMRICSIFVYSRISYQKPLFPYQQGFITDK